VTCINTKGTNHTLCRLELLRLAGTADTTVESPERNNLLVLRDVAEVGIRLWEFKAWGMAGDQQDLRVAGNATYLSMQQQPLAYF
jgi:hypothetical protein